MSSKGFGASRRRAECGSPPHRTSNSEFFGTEDLLRHLFELSQAITNDYKVSLPYSGVPRGEGRLRKAAYTRRGFSQVYSHRRRRSRIAEPNTYLPRLVCYDTSHCAVGTAYLDIFLLRPLRDNQCPSRRG
jgi:hypothetical protein